MDEKKLLEVSKKLHDVTSLLSDVKDDLRGMADIKTMPIGDCKKIWSTDEDVSAAFLRTADAFLKISKILNEM